MYIVGKSGIIHQWKMCSMCGPYIECGNCFNNCCNGGSGPECGCKEAYELQDEQYNKITSQEEHLVFRALVEADLKPEELDNSPESKLLRAIYRGGYE